MTKKSKIKHNKQDQVLKEKSPTLPTNIPRRRFLWRCLLFLGKILGSVGVAVSIFSFVFSRVTILPFNYVIIKTNPFYTPFVISNGGNLPIYNIHFTCLSRNITLKGDNRFINITFEMANISIPQLNPNESSSVEFKRIFNPEAPIISADIDVIIKYQVYLIHITKTFSQGFQTVNTANGEIVWLPVAQTRKP